MTKTDARVRAAQLAQDYAQVFSTAAGKRVLEDLEKNYLYSPTFQPLVVTEGTPPQNTELKYCPFYAAVRDGFKQCVLEIRNRIREGKAHNDKSPDSSKKKKATRAKTTTTKPNKENG